MTFNESNPQVAAVAAFLNENKNARLQLADTLDLTNANTSGQPALVFAGENLVIEPRDPDKRAVIRLQYPALNQKPHIGLLIQSGKVTLRNLRFEVDGYRSQDAVLAALVREGGEVLVENCLFVQKQAPSAAAA